MLIAGRRSVRFRHELARLAIEQAVQPSRLPDMHAAALAYLADRTDTDPARLAYHADQAGDRDAVLEYAPLAAEQASRLSAHRQAVAHYESALRYADALPADGHAELLERYAYELALLDRNIDGSVAEQQALEIWRAIGDVNRIGRLLAVHSSSLWALARSEEAYEAAHQAVALLEEGPEGPALAVAYAQLASLYMLGRRVHEAVEVGNRGVELAERFGDSAALARALNAVGAAQWFIDPDLAEVPC